MNRNVVLVRLAAEVAKTDPKLAYDMVLGADEPLPVGEGEPLPEASKKALIDSLGSLRTAIRYMNQGNYPNLVKTLALVVNNIGATMHAFSDLNTEAELLIRAGTKLLKSRGEVKRVKLAEVAASDPKLAFEMLLAKQSMEHTSPEALQKYLKEHPGADKSLHTVKKPEKEGEKGGGEKVRSREEIKNEYNRNESDFRGEVKELGRMPVFEPLTDILSRYGKGDMKDLPHLKQVSNGLMPEVDLDDREEYEKFVKGLKKELDEVGSIMESSKHQTGGAVPKSRALVLKSSQRLLEEYTKGMDALFEKHLKKRKELEKELDN